MLQIDAAMESQIYRFNAVWDREFCQLIAIIKGAETNRILVIWFTFFSPM